MEDALGVGGFGSTIVWKQFLFLLCASIPDNGDLLSSLAMTVSILFSDDLMPYDPVKDLYLFVTGLDPTVTEDDQHKKLAAMETASKGKDGKVSKADIFGGAEEAAARLQRRRQQLLKREREREPLPSLCQRTKPRQQMARLLHLPKSRQQLKYNQPSMLATLPQSLQKVQQSLTLLPPPKPP